jgi:hypothetical protein
MYSNEIKMRCLGQEARLQFHDLIPDVYEWRENHLDQGIEADSVQNCTLRSSESDRVRPRVCPRSRGYPTR